MCLLLGSYRQRAAMPAHHAPFEPRGKLSARNGIEILRARLMTLVHVQIHVEPALCREDEDLLECLAHLGLIFEIPMRASREARDPTDRAAHLRHPVGKLAAVLAKIVVDRQQRRTLQLDLATPAFAHALESAP